MNCGKNKARPNMVMCEDCAKKQSEKRKVERKERRELFLKLGICTMCGKGKPMPHKNICADCFYKEQMKNITYKRPEESKRFNNEQTKERMKKRRAERRQAGLCTTCGRELVDKRYVQCHLCRAKRNAKQMERLEKTRKRYNLIDGACLICGENVVEGKKYCPTHYAQKVKEMQHAATFIKRNPWKDDMAKFFQDNKRNSESRSAE